MSDVCKSFCPDGNCEGCKDGVLWCEDPRCTPNCPTCQVPSENDVALFWLLIIFLLCLMGITFIFLVGVGHPVTYAYIKKR